jgi:NADH-quinone oxidoreductase subunit L
MMILGFVVSFLFYIVFPFAPGQVSKTFNPLYKFLLNKWYFDEAYEFIFVRNIKKFGKFLSLTGDKKVIDGLGPDGISFRVLAIAKQVGRLQTGYVYHYAFAMLFGLTIFLSYFFIKG